ncbi:MAG: hypothetical protein DCC71_01425 [Proteobacteria bacterium]|nr:MAG: hypothetical protein DCC71_01425 [Pseudomonadota bacterium]
MATGAALLVVLACGAEEQVPAAPPPPATPAQTVAASPPPTIDRFTDLLRLGEHGQAVVSGGRARSDVWDLGGHYRPVLAQPPGSVRLGPIPAGEQCRVEFGVGLQGDLASGAVRVRMRVEQPPAADGRPLFEVELAQAPGGGWLDRSEPLAVDPGSEFSVLLEVEALRGAAASVGWSAPHVICRVPRAPSQRLAKPHVILISLDTLRADHLGVYGYGRDTSPVLDAFAADAWVFDRAFSPASWTLPSHASLFTAVAPSVHGAGHASPFAPLPADGVRTLAESLRDGGYWTIAFTAGGIMSRRNGLHRGFQWWTERTRANFASTLPGVFDAIGTAPTRPIFLVLHTYDVHGPYAYLPGIEAIEVPPRAGHAPVATASRCDAPACGDAEQEWRRIRSYHYHAYQRFERFDGIDDVVDAYDRGIRFVDAQLAVLFDRLRDVGVFDDAMIVITSDHGESIYERGLYVGHSYTLHDEEVRVPLVVRLPGGERGRSDALVELTDVAPWILDVAGLPRPESFHGFSPLARARGDAPPRRIAEGEAAHTGQRYARSRDWKAIAAGAAPMKSLAPAEFGTRSRKGDQLYDLVRDPGERTALPLDDSAPVEADAVRSAARGSPQPGLANGEPEPQLDPTQEQQLRELGYLR